jgi:hypothetical protein
LILLAFRPLVTGENRTKSLKSAELVPNKKKADFRGRVRQSKFITKRATIAHEARRSPSLAADINARAVFLPVD